ncbi:MAG: hypothetical protein HUU35_01990, partial [Armatimonadetes bacterium]|nr:hypothetical protein [Armatimonadota bacterium]
WRAMLLLLAGGLLAACGGVGPGPAVVAPEITLLDLDPPSFMGGAASATVEVPERNAAGVLVVLTATLLGPDGAIPVQVQRTGGQVTLTAELPPNLTTTPQNYTLTVTVQTGGQPNTVSETFTVPGLDAPAEQPGF